MNDSTAKLISSLMWVAFPADDGSATADADLQKEARDCLLSVIRATKIEADTAIQFSADEIELRRAALKHQKMQFDAAATHEKQSTHIYRVDG